jgi:cytochrome c peroxidase
MARWGGRVHRSARGARREATEFIASVFQLERRTGLMSWFRSTAPFLLGGAMVIGSAGCESGEPPSGAGAPAGVGQALQATIQSQAQKAQARKTEAEITTPAQRVDTRQLNEVVKEEVKGGEALEGPTPFDYLWMPSKAGLIKDEPLVVTVPTGFTPLVTKNTVPVSNPLTKGKYELGRQLYFDPRVSLDGTVACATCHNPAKGWTDGMAVSIGIDGQAGSRSAPSVLNAVYGRTMFWDGRAPSLEGQAQGPVQNPIEMGKQSYKQIVERLRTVPGYREQFEKVFGTSVTLDGMAKAIATFERVAAISGNSKYDKYKDDSKALSDSEKRGMILFGLRPNPDDDYKPNVVLQKASCTTCHVGFNFTDEEFHNLGIGWEPGKGSSPGKFKDLGRWAVEPIGARYDGSMGAFKTPTVRDVARTGPYMHDGSLATLEEVVDHYDKGGHPNPSLDKDIKPLKLTAQEKADLVAFMKALTGETKTLDELLPTLPPGPDGKTVDPRPALGAPNKKVAAVFHSSSRN